MENILKISLMIASLIALPRMILGLLEFLKWLFSFTIVFLFPTRGGNALKMISENYKEQTVFNSKKVIEEELPVSESSG